MREVWKRIKKRKKRELKNIVIKSRRLEGKEMQEVDVLKRMDVMVQIEEVRSPRKEVERGEKWNW